MKTITINVDQYSNEWMQLKSFVRSLGLTMRETENVRVRAGWAEAAKEMRQCGDDCLLIDDVFKNSRR